MTLSSSTRDTGPPTLQSRETWPRHQGPALHDGPQIHWKYGISVTGTEELTVRQRKYLNRREALRTLAAAVGRNDSRVRIVLADEPDNDNHDRIGERRHLEWRLRCDGVRDRWSVSESTRHAGKHRFFPSATSPRVGVGPVARADADACQYRQRVQCCGQREHRDLAVRRIGITKCSPVLDGTVGHFCVGSNRRRHHKP